MNLEIVVLDGFGIGAMEDAGEIREEDIRANTAASLARWCQENLNRRLEIPNLMSLGLGWLDPDLEKLLGSKGGGLAANAVSRRTALGYPGADTFAGHQTMMGADMSSVLVARVGEHISDIREILHRRGHETELLDGQPIVLVDRDVLVHDNLEADPGLNWNVSGRLTDHPFEEILQIAGAVREVAPVARVIAVGGYSDEPLHTYVRAGARGTVGLDTPASGFYKNGGLQVVHIGVEINHAAQLPEVAATHGVSVSLVGKAADILTTDTAVERLPGVETSEILKDATRCLKQGRGRNALTVVNVQQTDLAGHQQDPRRYVEVIEEFDRWLGERIPELADDDAIVIVADHGNDPLIGHAFHTREYVPCIAVTRADDDAGPWVRRAEDFASLAEVGASAAAALGIPGGEIGHGKARELFA